jgi:hypothetical protein
MSQETMILQPNSVNHLNCDIVSKDKEVKEIGESLFYVKTSPSYKRKGVEVLEGLYNVNCCQLTVVNASSDVIIVPVNRKLGYVQLVDVIPHTEVCDKDVPQVSCVTTHNFDVGKCMIDSNLGEERKVEMIALLNEFSDLFDKEGQNLGVTDKVEHSVVTTGEPIRQRAYRTSFFERREIQRQVDDMLKQGLIKFSESAWAHPVVLVKKKTGEYRFCVDYRKLNAVTVRNSYPLPRISDILTQIGNSRWLSSLDLLSAYWQVPVKETDQPKTAFITADGLYEFTRMPFGMVNSGSTFQALVDQVLGQLKWNTVIVYLDDIVVYSSTWAKHMAGLKAVFERLREAKLTIKTSKCKFATTELKVLGFTVNQKGIGTDPEKMAIIRDYPIPKTVKQVRSFLGLCSYYRQLIRGFAEIARPLTRLTKSLKTNDVSMINREILDVSIKAKKETKTSESLRLKSRDKITWDEETQSAFDTLKGCLLNAPVLQSFDEDSPVEIHVDASLDGLGCVVVQRDEKGREHLVECGSRTLTDAECKWSISEIECLALVWGLEKFRPYCFGRKVKVVTDHHALTFLANKISPNRRLTRWMLQLQEYDIEIVYKSGKKHLDADALSRMPSVNVITTKQAKECQLFTPEKISAEQDKDSTLKAVKHLIQTKEKLPAKWKLCRVNQENVLQYPGFQVGNLEWKTVIPEHLKVVIMRQFHDEPTAAHLGIQRTWKRIRTRFYWTQLYADVKKFVLSCESCQAYKKPKGKIAGLMMKPEIPTYPFEKVGIDFVGPFPRATSGHKHILVATDYLTKWAIVKAVVSPTADVVADFLIKEVMLRYNPPRILVSDRGTSFLADTVQKVLRKFGTRHCKTGSYHPQANSVCERFNGTLVPMLCHYTDKEHKNWNVWLPYIVRAYNTSVHDETKRTPYYLLHGREPVELVDAELENFQTGIPADVETRSALLDEETREARILLQEAQGKGEHRYNLRRRERIFNPGDLVMLFTPKREVGKSAKLIKKFEGPYTVTKKVNSVTYDVSMKGEKCEQRVNIQRLKPYHARG